jgi:hypothetical protein
MTQHPFRVQCSVDYSDRYAWPLILVLAMVASIALLMPVSSHADLQSSELPFWLAGIVSAIAFRNLWGSFGKDIGMCELAGAIGSMQWLVGAIFSYSMRIDHYRYQMHVESDVYFSYAVPGTAMFIMAMMLPVAFSTNTTSHRVSIEEIPNNVCWGILLGGMVAYLLPSFVGVGSLGFIFYILGNLRFTGAILFMFKRGKLSWVVPISVLAMAGVSARNSGMFHDALLWAAMMAIYFFLRRPTRGFEKLAAVAGGLALALTIQFVKAELREFVWHGQSDVSFSQLAYEEIITNQAYADEDELDGIVIRLNQGWIISQIMQNIPDVMPFVDGESVRKAAESALLPRFLAPDKQGAGGRENFELFTGFEIGRHTSMGISLLGESYGNYGRVGGCVMMFVFGLALRLTMMFFHKTMFAMPLMFFFIPAIMLQVVKAETDLVTVLNFITKSSGLCLILVFFLTQVIGRSRPNDSQQPGHP